MEENLPTNNYKLDPFFDLSPDLLIVAGYDGYFRKINPAVVKLLGYTQEELFAKQIKEFIYSEDREITALKRENLTKNNALLNFENRYVTKSGEIVWLSWTSIPLDEEKLVYAIAKNITHKKKLEEQRNILLTNLSIANKELKQFSYVTAHDLRAPVNNLLSIFNLLDVSKIHDKQTSGFIEILKSATRSLKLTLNNYVDALVKNDRLNLPLETLQINEISDRVQHSISALLLDAKATIHTNFEAVETIKFNRAYLESILLNLITNSIKYARPDYPPVISISSQIAHGYHQLIYKDNGLGFTKEQLESKVFGLQQKFHENEDSKGIGLYLVYNHMTNLGGKIEVESEVNAGTTFILSFKN